MSEDNRRRNLCGTFLAIINMDVCATNATGHIFHKHVMRSGFSKCHFPYFELILSVSS